MSVGDGAHSGFEYRTVLGAWINDISSRPRMEQWPSIEIDAQLERDFTGFFDMMRDVGLDSIILFGLFASGDWKPGLRGTVSPEREQAVRRILAEAKKRQVKVLYGLGLYSWGFDEIIRSNPDVRGTNPRIMCGSKEASHKIMEELIEYLASGFPFDGFQFESADLGRCECDKCLVKSRSQYHLDLNERMAKYVRSNWPNMVVEVYCPIWRGTRDDWAIWGEPSKQFTFMIDDVSRANRFGCNSRNEIISALGCAYGTRSGTYIYPPQRWDRLRWFVPILEKRAVHYRQLIEDGGRAVAIGGGPLVNPAEEATIRFSARMALKPFLDIQSVLVEVMEQMFRPRSRVVAEELADIFWSAEKAYWCSANFPPGGGELCLEPLFGKIAGPPIYLQTRMYVHNIEEYEYEINGIKKRFLKIQQDVGDEARCRNVVRCLDSVLRDLDTIKADRSMLKNPVSTTGPDSWTEESLWSSPGPP